MSSHHPLIRFVCVFLLTSAGLLAGCEHREPDNPIDAKATTAPSVDNATSTGAGGSSTSGGISSSTSGTGTGGSAMP